MFCIANSFVIRDNDTKKVGSIHKQYQMIRSNLQYTRLSSQANAIRPFSYIQTRMYHLVVFFSFRLNYGIHLTRLYKLTSFAYPYRNIECNLFLRN